MDASILSSGYNHYASVRGYLSNQAANLYNQTTTFLSKYDKETVINTAVPIIILGVSGYLGLITNELIISIALKQATNFFKDDVIDNYVTDSYYMSSIIKNILDIATSCNIFNMLEPVQLPNANKLSYKLLSVVSKAYTHGVVFPITLELAEKHVTEIHVDKELFFSLANNLAKHSIIQLGGGMLPSKTLAFLGGAAGYGVKYILKERNTKFNEEGFTASAIEGTFESIMGGLNSLSYTMTEGLSYSADLLASTGIELGEEVIRWCSEFVSQDLKANNENYPVGICPAVEVEGFEEGINVTSPFYTSLEEQKCSPKCTNPYLVADQPLVTSVYEAYNFSNCEGVAN